MVPPAAAVLSNIREPEELQRRGRTGAAARSFAQMDGMEGIWKYQRVYTFEPNNVVMLANFSRNYVAYLLPALLKVSIVGSCRGIKSQEMEKLVRSEVDMALALSASGCAWGRALKQKLEQGVNTRKLHKSPTKQPPVSSALPFSTCNQNNALNYMIFTELWTAPFIFIARPLPPISSPMTAKRSFRLRKAKKPKRSYRSTLSSRRTLPRGDEELHHCVRSLRSVLPGGSEMGVHELLSEVGSYVMCLELQVSILRCLLN